MERRHLSGLLLLLLLAPARIQVVRVCSDDQFKDAHGIRVVKYQSIVSMLESSLDLADVVSAASNVNLRVLRVLHRESIAGALVVPLPTSASLREIETFLTDGYTDIFIVKTSAIELKKVN